MESYRAVNNLSEMNEWKKNRRKRKKRISVRGKLFIYVEGLTAMSGAKHMRIVRCCLNYGKKDGEEKSKWHIYARRSIFSSISRLQSKIERERKKMNIEIECGRLTHFRLDGGALKISGLFAVLARLVDDLFILFFFSRLQLWRGLVALLPSYELRFVNIIDADFCKHLKTHKTKSSRLPMRTKCVECLRLWLCSCRK